MSSVEHPTMADHLKLDLMDFCNCNRSQQVMFMCQEDLCPNKETQPLYCALCIQVNHKHMPFLISAEVDKVS